MNNPVSLNCLATIIAQLGFLSLVVQVINYIRSAPWREIKEYLRRDEHDPSRTPGKDCHAYWQIIVLAGMQILIVGLGAAFAGYLFMVDAEDCPVARLLIGPVFCIAVLFLALHLYSDIREGWRAGQGLRSLKSQGCKRAGC